MCALCTEALDQAPLTDWHGLPVHIDCASTQAAIEAKMIADLEAMILAEQRRSYHRVGARRG